MSVNTNSYQKILLADYKAGLKPYRRSSKRFWCPACGCHNLTFSDFGKWNCWNNPTREHRIEIIQRLVPDFKACQPQSSQAEVRIDLVPRIYPSQLGYPLLTDEVLATTVGNKTTYRYGDKQRVVRIERSNRRYIFPQYFDDCHWVNGAGDMAWQPYGLSRLLPYPGITNLMLVVEGQKCVEIARSRSIPALCFQAGDFSNYTLLAKIRAIERKFPRLLLAVLPDNDKAGLDCAKQIVNTARYLNVPTLWLDPLQIVPNLGEGEDIEQMVGFDRTQLMRVVKCKLKFQRIKR